MSLFKRNRKLAILQINTNALEVGQKEEIEAKLTKAGVSVVWLPIGVSCDIVQAAK